jgi:hypothetical protein
MKQKSPEYTTQDLLAFYDRVKPVLHEWLAKPVWTARETAMLCAGYVPHNRSECEKSETCDQPESIPDGAPIDPHGYVPPDCDLYSYYLMLLTGKEAAPPRQMVQMLAPVSRKANLVNVGEGRRAWIEVRRAFNLGVLRELQWFFMIGNAVGLQVPALVSFGLLDQLSRRTTDRPINDAVTVKAHTQTETDPVLSSVESSEPSGVAHLTPEARPIVTQRNVKKRQPPPTTPEERGYHTTEEVAGLLKLQPDTLNKYAREDKRVEGFKPYKRENGRVWQWRNEQQQAVYEVRIGAGKPGHRAK